MISSWDTYELTDEGKFFTDVMQKKADSSSPAVAK
jgi:hypothetical protein